MERQGSSRIRIQSVLLIVIGALLLRFGTLAEGTDQTAVLLLGLLLLLLGAGAFFFFETVEIELAPGEPYFLLRTQRLFTLSRRKIALDQVTGIKVVRIGTRVPRTYFVKVSLKNGRSVPTGLVTHTEDEAHRLAGDLAEELGSVVENIPDRGIPFETIYPLSAMLAVGTYALWYRIDVGPLSAASWAGTAPPVMITTAFLAISVLLRKLLPAHRRSGDDLRRD